MYKYPGARNAVNLSSTVLYNTAFTQHFFFFFLGGAQIVLLVSF